MPMRLGYGMSTLVGTTGGFDFKKFVFPGTVACSERTCRSLPR